MRIILGVSAGIAAYKSILVLRLLREAGHSVRVIPTAASLQFVGRATWEALSGESAADAVFEDITSVAHVRLGQGADLMIVAPATADLLARAAGGRADDLLTSTLLTAHCPVLFAPAMHTEMWENAATRANVATLRSRGLHVLEPAVGRLTGVDTGPGRLPDPEDIIAAAFALLDSADPQVPSKPSGSVELEHPTHDGGSALVGPSAAAGTGVAADGVAADGAAADGAAARRPQDLVGRSIMISAGGTIEPIDPVRFLGNRSSGRQGIALATAARDRGAAVHLIAANVSVPICEGVDVTRVETALELRDAVRAAASETDVVIMTAAVADFRPAELTPDKIKKVPGQEPAPIRLVQNPDILAEIAQTRLRAGQIVVGFAAETGDSEGDVLAHGRAKARRKGADLLVINDVSGGRGFGADINEITIVDADGATRAAASGTKLEVSDVILDQVQTLF